MSPSDSERWRKVEDLFHAALELAPSKRAAFLVKACAGDEGLRGEVESLLSAATENSGFLDRTAMDVRAEEIAKEPLGSLSGRRIGPYVVGSLIGVGGMAEVYRARDVNLDRDVAIKVLLGSSGIDAEGIGRFQREARLLASVKHPNVALVHGFEQVDDMCALVMEAIDGETLADRIARAPLSVDQAVTIATQMAAAVEAAHAKGIIHRDLKPANIRIASDGTVKVLDFGLAKLQPSAISQESANPSKSIFSTQGYSIVGTIAYMSPEQARGRTVDLATDIWSWGCVVYEMVSGRRAFEGSTATDTIARIAGEDPDWSRLPAATPPRLRSLIEDCLQKESGRRPRDISEVRRRLEIKPPPRTSASHDAEISLSMATARGLFFFAQFGYLAMYCAALYFAPRLNSENITLIVSGAALIGIPVRIFLISAVGLSHPDASRKFHKLFPLLLLLDGAWAASPLLIKRMPIGLALAAAAALAYVPFSQRTLIRRLYRP